MLLGHIIIADTNVEGLLDITRRSPRTGEDTTRRLHVTREQIEAWRNGAGLIQHIMPELSPEDREFLMTGYTPEDLGRDLPAGG